MGWNSGWVGVQGLEPSALWPKLDLVETDETAESFARPFTYVQLTTGWIILAVQDADWVTPDRFLGLVPADVRILGCQNVDAVSHSFAWEVHGDELVWSVEHSPENDREIEETGLTPIEFDPIRRELRAKQIAEPGVDHLIEGPPMLFEAICGFNPRNDSLRDVPFKILNSLRPPRKRQGILELLFGRGY